jgi:hypothetical protein
MKNVRNFKKGTPRAKKQTNFDDLRKRAHYCTIPGLASCHRIIILFSKIDFNAKLLILNF